MGQFQDSELLCEALAKEDRRSVPVFVSTVNIYYTGLTMLVLASRYRIKKKKRLALAKKCKEKMKTWARISPSIHLHRLLHLQAEWAAYEGKMELSREKFAQAMNEAASSGSLCSEAVICERFSVILAAAGETSESKDMLCKARDLFHQWGSIIKVGALTKQLNGGNARD